MQTEIFGQMESAVPIMTVHLLKKLSILILI